MSYLNTLLKDKLPDSSEIEIHLFEFCNLSCAFCGQDHDSTVGMSRDSIMEKAALVNAFIKNNNTDSHIINIMGGEIFNDEISDDMFELYHEFYKAIYKPNVRFNWVTNLVFNKNKRVKQFIDNHPNSFISTSYDFSGRGMNLERSLLFETNLKVFKGDIKVIGFVLTRPAIKKILTKTDRLFEHLYDNYHLYFDYYVPELSAEKMMPSEQQILDVMLFIADKYPKVSPIKDLLENDTNKMTCYSLNKLTLLPDNREVKCRYIDYEEDVFETKIDYSNNDAIIQSHLDRAGCFECKWFDKCQFRCFVQADYAKLERLDVCLFKTFFDKTQ